MAATLYRASVRTGVRMVHNRWSAGGGQIRPELRVASQCTKTAQELSDQVHLCHEFFPTRSHRSDPPVAVHSHGPINARTQLATRLRVEFGIKLEPAAHVPYRIPYLYAL